MKKVISVFLLLSLLLTGCQKNQIDSEQITIVASFFPLYDFSQKIGGKYVEVINLIPFGASTHGYELSVKDKITIEEADLFVYNGAALETFLDDLLGSLKNSSVVLVNTSHKIDLLTNQDNDHHNGTDPHVWLHPLLAKKQMEEIYEKLSELDPDHESYYYENLNHYSVKLDELDIKLQNLAQQSNTKELLVSHQAFGYFTLAYGFNQKSIFGFSDEGEPSIGQIRDAIDYIKQHQLKVIFVDKHNQSKIAATIQQELPEIEIATLNPMEIITKAEFEAGVDYFSLMAENLVTLSQYLGE